MNQVPEDSKPDSDGLSKRELAILKLVWSQPPVDSDRLADAERRAESMRAAAEEAIASEIKTVRYLHSATDRACQVLTAEQEEIFNVMHQFSHRADFRDLKEGVPSWDYDTNDEAIVKALKRIRDRLRKQLPGEWDFEIRKAGRAMVWKKKAGYS